MTTNAEYMRAWRAANPGRQAELSAESRLRRRALTELGRRHPHELVAIMREMRTATQKKEDR